MAILKCKMCGGDLNITADEKIIECEYCGTTQTIPEVSDEKKTNLFNRANRLRIDNEFDKAAGVYESIVSEFPEEAEGYWGLVLCSYGIEYVDDAKTGKKIPTCHRTLTSSVMDDDNFVQACENADVVARGVYREEAKAIDKLQQQIIAVVENEEPYDVFICYKETDDITKSRTEDSLIAQDIYTELIKEGYKVFFSRVTLRDKAGTEYEPYIYAALKSAKIMLAIGTKFDYYDAVWVKNEWGRFLSMMAEDSTKHLIPCFKNLDAYDIPKEFKNLQALDMGEVTFFKNLTDNVERFIPNKKTEQIKVVETVSVTNNATVEPLLKRVFMFLEEGNWESADEYAEKVLDIDPECAEAYLGKLMSEFNIKRKDDFNSVVHGFESSVNYQNFIRYSKESMPKEYEEIQSVVRRFKQVLEKHCVRNMQSCFSVYGDSLIFIDSTGVVRGVYPKYKEGFKINWDDIISVVAARDGFIGLKTDGTVKVIYLGDEKSDTRNYDVGDWNNIVAISTCYYHTVGLKSDGTVVAVGRNADGECEVSEWKDIVAISIGDFYTVGLKSDGTVVAVGNNRCGQCEVSEWKDIVAISAGNKQTLGLKCDGTVVATEYMGEKSKGEFAYREYKIDNWKDIVAISAGNNIAVGLKADGTVVSTYHNVSDWKDIVAICTDYNQAIGLRKDGTLLDSLKSKCDSNFGGWGNIEVPIEAETREELYQKREKISKSRMEYKISLKRENEYDTATAMLKSGNVSDIKAAMTIFESHKGWKDCDALYTRCKDLFEEAKLKLNERIVNATKACNQIVSGFNGYLTVKDGTVKVNVDDFKTSVSLKFKLKSWKNIVAISTDRNCDFFIVGLKSDGTVVATGDNEYGQCNVEDWQNIVAVSAGTYHTVGLKSDGTVVAVGDNEEGQCDVFNWADIVAISAGEEHTVGLKKDGTLVSVGDNEDGQCEVSEWKDIVAISAGDGHTVGLKSDGTVVSTEYKGDEEYEGRCDVSEWSDIIAICAGYTHTVGLKSDGTVVSAGDYAHKYECDVSDWKDIVAISVDSHNTIGLKSDGTIVSD